MIDPTVRPATADDAPELRWLEQEARSSLVGQRGGDRWLECHPAAGPSWEQLIGTHAVYVAHIDDVVVGYIRATITEDLATIDDVFVHAEARELGFGDELLAAVVTTARESGARLLEAEALPGDRDTKNLYERAGIKARLITVSTPL